MNASVAVGAAAPPQRADAAAWMAAIAGNIGALMASLDISIINSALPTIQGEIGASGTEGTRIASAFIIAEIVIIPLTGWLVRMLGLRTLLLVAVTGFTAFSVMCGMATTLNMMVVGRVGQGLFGGTLIPTAMMIIATRLPPPQQPAGMALFSVTAVFGPLVGPLLGGWLTENYSWHYAFFINVPIGIILVILLFASIPHQKLRLGELRQADWLGIIGMAVGLGCMTAVLEEGQREQWFESGTIVRLTMFSIFGYALLVAGQFIATKPVIRLSLLFNRQFGSVIVMTFVVGTVIYGPAYVIPQFLSNIAGYNALQSGYVVLIAGIPSLLFMPLVPWVMKTVDMRIGVAAGLGFLAVGCWMDTGLTADSVGSDFTVGQVVRGFGTLLAFVFLNQAAISSVAPEDAGDASGLATAMRNIGGSVALAAIAVLQDQRDWLHNRRLEEFLNANSIAVQDYLAGMSRTLGDPSAALRIFDQAIQREALVMTYSDLFWLLAVGIAAVIPLVLFLRPLPKGMSAAAAH
ncbi:DHA2 family efflux MFS transporter permease subunit [Sphingobium lactosutens]|jgi:DHA2 family multidrug resistance protein|uniref:Major facilitator superfamily (MFS) profile domain-containing protein n=1 Tax=Sphingobium lactosutens DS20 TaxID=1331060 RepID=T0J1W5_9SPHN|nr:DHA2 family efflux MFS transporter permease subunit [Sphingobium lactosutens]EQB15929.1 hypothetical protein RLDS_09435 [Sphingobium lactosutens DS20]